MITLTQLEYVVSVDTFRNFALAAEHCHVTQPTLSMQVKKLEEFLGLLLFDRSKKPVVPTNAGVKLVEQARKVLRAADRFQEMANEAKETISGTLRIGIIPTLAPSLVPGLIAGFKSSYPEIDLQIEEKFTTDIVYALKKDILDVGILVSPLSDREIKIEPLFKEEILVYAHPEHKLWEEETLDLEDISSQGLWLLGEGHCFRSQVLNLCGPERGEKQLRGFSYKSGSLETLRRLVDQEGGYTLLPKLVAVELPARYRKNLRPITDPVPVREVSLAVVRSFAKERLVGLLKRELLAGIPAEVRKSGGQVVEWS